MTRTDREIVTGLEGTVIVGHHPIFGILPRLTWLQAELGPTTGWDDPAGLPDLLVSLGNGQLVFTIVAIGHATQRDYLSGLVGNTKQDNYGV